MNFDEKHKFLLQIIAGPLLFVLTYYACLGMCNPKQAAALATCMWMGIWWVLRPVDIAVTALLPILINSFFGMIPMGGIISRYFSEIVILLLGSDLISITWESSKLDQRLALRSLCLIGASLKQQIFVWLAASTILSVFLPNVVTVQILIPVAIAMLKFLGEKDISSSAVAVPILLAIVWGAGIGGFGSPLGGAANLVAIGYIENLTGKEFMYGDWVIRFVPLLAVVMFLNFFFVLRIKTPINQLPGSSAYFKNMYAKLGQIRKSEIIGFSLFFVAMVLSFVRPYYMKLLPLMKPAYVFFFFGMLTFVLKDENDKPMLTWKVAEKKLGWGMMFLFAGGLALGKLVTDTGAAKIIAEKITLLPLTGGIETFLVFGIFSTILTEISSNTAAAAIAIPVVLTTCQQMGVNPIPFLLGCIVAVNCAYVLPVSIRAIGCNHGLDPAHLLRYGAPLSISGVVIISLLCYFCMRFWPMFNAL